jgi:type IV pilus assembly protein PilV
MPRNDTMAFSVLPLVSLPAIGRKRGEAGFTMLEVLVSLVIILLGLLGLAGLIVRSNQVEMESYQRVQALTLVQDMADRINANRKNAVAYAGTTRGAGYNGGADEDCAGKTGADLDLCQWHNTLLGSAEKSGGQNIGAMIGARGCIDFVALDQAYVVSVAWQGLGATTEPVNTCGLNEYGDDKLRRVVTSTVRIGALL